MDFAKVPDPSSGSPGPDPRNASAWERRLQELLEFRSRFGHINVPRHWSENPRLANWVNNQRRLIRLGLLTSKRHHQLESLGISWDGLDSRRRIQEDAWVRMFGALRAFHRVAGHLNVPRGWTVEPQLAAWLSMQRHLWRSGALSEARELRLSALDPGWHEAPARERAAAELPAPKPDRRAAAWERRCRELEQYRDRHGSCAIPARGSEHPALALWVVRQRALRRRGALPAERLERLQQLGFVWAGDADRRALEEQRWQERLQQLSAYIAANGHSAVSLQDRRWPGLAAWVFRQRIDYRRGRLSADHVRRLDDLKFLWNPRQQPARSRPRHWEEMFAKLLDYRRRHGHLEIPVTGEHRRLSQWLKGQRRRQRRGKLAAALARRLEDVGVCWNDLDRRWEARYAELLQYRRVHGDCNVDMTGRSNGRLARWVSAQRTSRKSGRLSTERITRLEAAGFLWSAAPRATSEESKRPSITLHG